VNSEFRRHQTWSKLRDISILLKPKISMLNVFTGVTAYVVAAGDLANLPLFVISGFLAASGSGALNHVLDADLDNKMSRTARRPIPSGRISKFPVLLMGLSMVITGLAIALLVFNPLNAFFIWLGVFIYVVVYTAWLKRRSVWDIVVGGLSGSCPPLAG
jgi:protoheme IX farnesyltransferase